MTDLDRVYVRFRGRTLGPLTHEKVKDLIRRGQVTRLHELSGDGITWSKAEEFGDFFPQAQPAGFGQFPGEAMGPGMGGAMGPGAMPEMPGSGGPPGVAPGQGAMHPAMGGGAHPAQTTAQWFAHVQDEKRGPISFDQMQLWAHAKVLLPDSLVWNSSMENWEPAQKVLPQLFESLGASSSDTEESVDDADLVQITLEMSRQSNWLIGCAIALFIAALVLLVGQAMPLMNVRPGTKNIELLRPILGLALGGLLIAIGVMMLLFHSKLKQLVGKPNRDNMLEATQSLSNFLAVMGIGGVVWALLLVMLLIIAAGTGIDVLRLIR